MNLNRALNLARLAQLAYLPEAEIRGALLQSNTYPDVHYFAKDKTEALLVANTTEVVVVFPGTACWDDWLTDFKIKLIAAVTGRIHFGFNEALDLIWKDLFKAFDAAQYPDKEVWLTGHSLGGALAALSAERLIRQSFPIAGLYTFGQPCVGDRAFCQYFRNAIRHEAYRFVNDEDLVPQLLPFFGYCHFEHEYFIDRDGKIRKDNLFRHWWRSRSESVAIRSSEHASRYRAENPGDIRDHGMEFYIQAIERNLPQRKGEKRTFTDYING